MTDEAIEFYRDNKTPIEKIVAIGMTRRGLQADAIRQAAQEIYDDIQEGREIKPIRIAWEVFAHAKHLGVVAEVEENKRIAELEAELAWHRQPWYKRVFRTREVAT